MPVPRWTLLVPLKPLAAAKQRLRGAVPGLPHEELVLRVAVATVSAALAADGVNRLIVVTDDAGAGRRLKQLGADVHPDPVRELNAALTLAASTLAGPVAALPADLPALRPAELAEALARSAGRRAFVPDAEGSGTVLLTAASGGHLDPRFGLESAAAHRASGALPLDGAWPTLRRDVDTAADLTSAAHLGWSLPAAYGEGMQGTVATFDAQQRSGSLLLDDGTPVTFDSDAFAASGLRLLRIGQRVRLEYDDDGHLIKITIPTMR